MIKVLFKFWEDAIFRILGIAWNIKNSFLSNLIFNLNFINIYFYKKATRKDKITIKEIWEFIVW